MFMRETSKRRQLIWLDLCRKLSMAVALLAATFLALVGLAGAARAQAAQAANVADMARMLAAPEASVTGSVGLELTVMAVALCAMAMIATAFGRPLRNNIAQAGRGRIS